MITIPINGIIAEFQLESEINVTPISLQKSLDDANGEDILITINSPGGSVWAGLKMFSMIKNYPGHVETRVVSLAASMGSILALAGKVKTIENTAMYYIHNAQGGARGDYRELLEESNWLKDVSALIANLYAEHTTLSIEKAQKLMDDNSHFFGKDLEFLGFKNIDTGNNVDAAIARVEAENRFADITAKLSDKDISNDLKRVAASIAGDKKQLDIKNIMSLNKTESHNVPAAGGDNNKKQGVIMTLDELRNQYPDLYNEAVKAGVDKERKRVSAHLKLGAKTGAMEHAQKFIEEGRSVLDEDVHAEYLSAGLNRNDLKDREDDNQDTGNQPTGNKGGDDNIDAFEKGMSGGDELFLDDEEVE